MKFPKSNQMIPKLYRLEVYVYDFENIGLQEIITEIEQNRYCCVKVKSAEEPEITNWADNHELNKSDTLINIIRSYFNQPKQSIDINEFNNFTGSLNLNSDNLFMNFKNKKLLD